MSNSNGYIKAPVNIAADLGYVLGTGSGDLGYNIANGNINKWAVFKPVRNSAIGWVSPRNTLATLGFGSSIPVATTVQGLIDLYDGGDNGWVYYRPRGRAYGEYYRAADFCKIVGSGGLDTVNYGYNHNAPNPFGSAFSVSPTTVARAQGSVQCEQRRTIPAGDWPDTNLAVTDFNDLSASTMKMNYYGVLLVPPSSSYAYKLVGSTDTIGNTRGKETLSHIFTLTESAYALGEWTVYPILSNIAFSDTFINIQYSARNTALPDSRRVFPIPGVSPVTLTVIDDYIVITCTARAQNYVSAATYYVQWSFTVNNYHDYAINLTGGKARFRFQGKSFSDTMMAGEVEINLGDITVPAGGSYSYPGEGLTTITELTDRDLAQLIIGFTYNSQLKTGYREFIVPAPPM